MRNLEAVRLVANRVVSCKLDGYERIITIPVESLARMYNGIGPEWFPSVLREAVDALHPDLQPVAMVHDVDWSTSDGTKKFFDESNERFKANGYKIAKVKYGWYNPVRYWRMNQARVFGNLCQTFGWSAYRSAYEKSVRVKY